MGSLEGHIIHHETSKESCATFEESGCTACVHGISAERGNAQEFDVSHSQFVVHSCADQVSTPSETCLDTEKIQRRCLAFKRYCGNASGKACGVRPKDL